METAPIFTSIVVTGMAIVGLTGLMGRMLWLGRNRQFESVNQRFDRINERFNGVDRRFDAMNQKFDTVDQQFQGVNGRTPLRQEGLG